MADFPQLTLKASLSITGNASQSLIQVNDGLAPSVLTITGIAPVVNIGRTFQPIKVDLTATAFAPNADNSGANLDPQPATALLSIASKAAQSNVQINDGLAPAGLSLTGKAPTATVGGIGARTETPAKTDLTWSGKAPTADSPGGVSATPTTATFALTAKGITVIETIQDGPTPAPLTLTAFAPVLFKEDNPVVDTAALSLTGIAPTTVQPVSVTPDTFDLSVAAQAPAGLLSHIKSPAKADFSLTGFASTLSHPVTVTGALAGLTVTATTPFPSVGIVAQPSTAVLTVAGFAPIATVGDVAKAPAKADLSLVAINPVSTVNRRQFPPRAGLSVVGKAPASSIHNPVVIPAKIAFSLVGKAPRKGQGISASSGSLVYNAKTPSVQNTHVVSPGSCLLSVVGKAISSPSDNIEKATGVGRLSLSGKTINDLDGLWVVQGEETDIWTTQNEESDIWQRAA